VDVRAARPTADGPRWLLTLVFLLSGPVAGGAVLLVAGLRPELAVLTGCLFSGGVAVLSGGWVLLEVDGRSPQARPALLLIGLAMVTWGIGQALVGYSAAGGSTFPTVGDAFSTIAAPFAIAGLLVALRGGGRHASSVRFALDAVMLGSAVSLVVWRAAFRGALFQHGAGLADVTAVLMLLLEVTIVSLLLLAYLRDLDRGMLLATAGMVLYCVADLCTIRAVAQPGGQWPWGSAVLWCVAWPLVAVGILGFRPRVRRDDDWYDADTRVTTATGAVSTVAICLFLVLLVREPQIDAVSVSIGLLLVAAFGVREGVAGLYRRRLLATLTERAVRDPLTALLNRRGLGSCLLAAARSGDASLLTLDLDGFKEVNDILGHSRGDDLLVAVSRRLENAIPPESEVFRIGGDEFAVVVPGQPEHVEDVAVALLEAVRRAAQDVPGAVAVGVTASVGVARVGRAERHGLGRRPAGRGPSGDVVRSPTDGLGVLVESSAALRAAKLAGRDRVVVYDGDVAAAHRRAQLVERRLHEAVANQDIDVHYQPILNLASRRVVGVEALARWTDPVVGRVAPDEFIPLAEQSGLIGLLGAGVLRRAAEDLASVSDRLPDISVAVNASAVQVRHPAFADDVLEVLRSTGLATDRLTIEVTESVFVDVDDPALVQLTRLREQGLDIAIDDFGSGFSALSYLSRLPASVLKIDQSLTRQLSADPRSLAVLDAVVALARTMPMWVVVEGVETQEVADLVRGTGAGNVQGWLYSPAVPIDQLADVVARIQDEQAVVAGDSTPTR
jgi:diguanylate cyclase (GGDEF)-like protein